MESARAIPLPRTPKVKASCPDCGGVTIDPTGIFLHTAFTVELVDDEPHERELDDRSYFEFMCPRCDECVRHDAPPVVRAELIDRAGVKETRIHIPAEATERHRLGAIVSDTVLDAIGVLQRVDALASLIIGRG